MSGFHFDRNALRLERIRLHVGYFVFRRWRCRQPDLDYRSAQGRHGCIAYVPAPHECLARPVIDEVTERQPGLHDRMGDTADQWQAALAVRCDHVSVRRELFAIQPRKKTARSNRIAAKDELGELLL